MNEEIFLAIQYCEQKAKSLQEPIQPKLDKCVCCKMWEAQGTINPDLNSL